MSSFHAAPIPVAVLVLPSVVPFDLGVPMQVFGYPRPDLGARRYRVTLCGERRGPVRTSSGFELLVTHGLAALRHAHTIVLPGIDDLDVHPSAATIRALRAAHARGARLVSICTGAFVLADAGLLEGRAATTHWLDAPLLATRFPNVNVDANVLYTDDNNVLTSAGIAAGIDLCLHVVRSDYGSDVANAVARRMVVAPHRSGGQAQFVSQPVADAGAGSLESTRTWILENLGNPLTIAGMARHAHMSVRTFARRFTDETGMPPLQWLLRQRVLEAQRLLESTARPVEEIARVTGFGAAVTMRHHFRRLVRTSPQEYRRAFRSARDGSGGTTFDTAP